MAVKTKLTEEEYLRTSFPGVDQEYLDGELVERSMPDYSHGSTQLSIGALFLDLRKREGLPYYAGSEVRHRLRDGRYAIPDVSVHWPAPPGAGTPSHAPLIVIEILSPDDRMTEVLAKLQEYVTWGVPHVWLIDPRTRQFSIYDRNGLRHVPEFAVPEANRSLTAADIFD